MDYDFIAFTFGEYNSYDDFGIYRVIKDRHSDYLAPTINDKTAEIAGRDGAYLFSSQHKPK
jgi:phage-related protein